jgi:hypothetical protein
MNHRLLSLVSITALVTAADAFATQTPPQTPTQPSQPIRTGGGSASQTPTDSKGRTAPSRPIQRDGRGGHARPPAAAGGHGPIAPNQGDAQAMRPQLRTIFTWRSPIRPSEANPWPTGSWHNPSMWVVNESALRAPNGGSGAQVRPRFPAAPTDGATIEMNADIKLGADTQIHTLRIGFAEVRLSGSRLAVEGLSVAEPAVGEARSLASGKWVPRLTLSSMLEVLAPGKSAVNDVSLKEGGALLFRGGATITRLAATAGTTITARRGDDAVLVGGVPGGAASGATLTLNEVLLERCGVEAPNIRWGEGSLGVDGSVLSAGTIVLAGSGSGRVSSGARLMANTVVVGPRGSIEFESGSVTRATELIAMHGDRSWDALQLGGYMNTRHFLAMQPNKVTAEITDSGRLEADALVCVGWRSRFPLLRISGSNTDLGIFNPPDAQLASGGAAAASGANPFLLSSVERLMAVPAQAKVGRAVILNGTVELGRADKDAPGHLQVGGDLSILSGLLVTNGSLVKAESIEIGPAPEGVTAAGVLRAQLPSLDQEGMPEALKQRLDRDAPKGEDTSDAIAQLYTLPALGAQAAATRKLTEAMRESPLDSADDYLAIMNRLASENAAELEARYAFYYSQMWQAWAKAQTIDEKLSVLWAAEASFVEKYPASALEVGVHASKATGIAGYPSREEADRLRRDPDAWMGVHARLGMQPPIDGFGWEIERSTDAPKAAEIDPKAMTELGFLAMLERANLVPMANGAMRGWGLLDAKRVSNNGYMRIEHEPSYWRRWFGGANSVSHGAALGGSLGDLGTYGYLVTGSYEQKADGVISFPVSGTNKVRHETHAGRYVSNLTLAAALGAPVARGGLALLASWLARIDFIQSLLEVMRLSPTGVADKYPLIASDASFTEPRDAGRSTTERAFGAADFGALRLRVDPAEEIEIGSSYRLALLAGPVEGRPMLGRSCSVPGRDDAFFALDIGPVVERSLAEGIQPTAQTVVDARVLSIPRRVPALAHASSRAARAPSSLGNAVRSASSPSPAAVRVDEAQRKAVADIDGGQAAPAATPAPQPVPVPDQGGSGSGQKPQLPPIAPLPPRPSVPSLDEPMTRFGDSSLYGVPMKRKLLIVTHGQDSAIEAHSSSAARGGVGGIADLYAEFARGTGLSREWDVVTFDWRQYATGEHDTHGWRNVSLVASKPVVDELVGRTREQIFRLPAVRAWLAGMSGVVREKVGAAVGELVASIWEGPAFGDGYEASRIARQIGTSLADWMIDSGMGYEALEEVHFIAEGSSVWMADAFAARLHARAAAWPSGRAPAVHITAFNGFSNSIDRWIPVGEMSGTAASFEHFADGRWITLTGNDPSRLGATWVDVKECDPAVFKLDASSLVGSPDMVAQRIAASIQSAAVWPTDWYRLTSRAVVDRVLKGGVEPLPGVPGQTPRMGAIVPDCMAPSVGFINSPMYRDYKGLGRP